ncbi:MAG TPA: hypothetical protein VJA21_00895 [Verrucomicrobiae bacterium]
MKTLAHYSRLAVLFGSFSTQSLPKLKRLRNAALATLTGLLAGAGFQVCGDPLGAAFAYQGQLNIAGAPAQGSYDLKFTLYADASGGSAVGGPVTNTAVSIANGLFSVVLDFGSSPFTGSARWLEIGVRTNSIGAFVTLAPRQALLPAPYAVYGSSAGSANTLSGVLPTSSLVGTYSQPLTFSSTANSFVGSGAGLTALNANALSSGTVPDARLSGNVALRAGGNTFTGNQTVSGAGRIGIGTPAPQTPLDIDVSSGDASLRLQSSGGASPVVLHHLGSSGTFTITNGGQARVAVQANGNVGIGTVTPNDRLEVLGANGAFIRVDGGAGISGVKINETNSPRWNLFFRQWQSPNLIVRDEKGVRDTMTFESGTGRVGIGTSTPQAPLHVQGDAVATGRVGVGTTAPQAPLHVEGNVLATGRVGIGNSTPLAPLHVEGNVVATGRMGIGTTTPQAQLDVNGDVVAGREAGTTQNWMNSGRDATCHRVIGTANQHAGFGIAEGTNIVSPMVWMYSQPGNAFAVRKVDYGAPLASAPTLFSVGSDGVTRVQTLTITGGADVAEPFPISSAEIPKGAVVIIDEDRPGRLKISERAYDTRVAGIVSGANGIAPGISLSQQGAMEGDRNVALSGRVYTLVDATRGPIKPGDLLTTSDTPGHAMKAADSGRAQGAILGKAMTALQKGRGFVLVLVSLQ